MNKIKMSRDGNIFTLSKREENPRSDEGPICIIFICVILLTIILTLSVRQGIENRKEIKQNTEQVDFKIGR